MGNAALGGYVAALLGGLAAATLFALSSTRAMSYGALQATSVLQGAARHNSFIAQALAANLLGTAGFETAILAAAIVIPVNNVAMVMLMVIALQTEKCGSLPLAILRDLARNLHIISIALALLANRIA